MMKSVNSPHHIVTTSNNLVLLSFFLQAILLVFPTRYIMVGNKTMGLILPPQAVVIRSIGESKVCLVLCTTPLNSLSLAELTDPPDRANMYQGQTTSI